MRRARRPARTRSARARRSNCSGADTVRRAYGLQRHGVERHRQARILVERRAGLDAGLGDRPRRSSGASYCACIAPSANSRPEPTAQNSRVLEHLAHRIDAEDAVRVGDERGDLRRFVGIVLLFLRIEEVLLLEDRVQLAERLEDARLVGEVEVARAWRAGSGTRAGARRCRTVRCRCPGSGRSCPECGRTARTAGCRRTWSASRRRWRSRSFLRTATSVVMA